MQKTHFKNLKDLLQKKYACPQTKENSRSTSIAEVLQNLRKKPEITPLQEEIINFTKAVGLHGPISKKSKHQQQPSQQPIQQQQIIQQYQSNIPRDTSKRPPTSSKNGSRNNSSQSRNTSAHSIINDTNRSIAPKIPKGLQTGRLRDRQSSKDISKDLSNVSQSKVNNSNTIDLVNLIKSQQKKEKETQDSSICSLIEETCFLNKGHFLFSYVIGKGGFGKVWKVELKKTRQAYAMKEMMKAKIIAKRSINSVMNERELLSQLRNVFLVNMCFAFQDRDNLYLVMDLLTGGDLRYHIGRMRRFKEQQLKFFVACIVSGLEYLHNNGVIHRDIKPENIVLDRKGYARITDLGIARKIRPDNSSDTSGTPGYMAPEVMCRQNHGIAVDYFALGVIAYEFMMGKRPYQGKSRKEIRDQILAKQAQIKRDDILPGWTLEAVDFINKLLQRKPQNRLGYNGPNEVKSHPWLRNIQWDKLYQKQLEAPYMPQNVDWQGQQISDGEESQDELIKENQVLLRKNSVQNLFNGYSYDCNQDPSYKSTASTHNTSQQNESSKF